MDLILVNLIDGLVTGLLLFMLSSGLTLIFSMMGVLNFAHASFYMLGAYFAYQISLFLAFGSPCSSPRPSLASPARWWNVTGSGACTSSATCRN